MTVKLSSNQIRRFTLYLFMGSVVFLSGCESSIRTDANKKNMKDIAESNQTARDTEQMALCQKELEAIEPVDKERYESLKKEFDRLMNGAAQYAGVRSRANIGTQEMVDALYLYKVKRLCSDVSQALLTALADRGERG